MRLLDSAVSQSSRLRFLLASAERMRLQVDEASLEKTLLTEACEHTGAQRADLIHVGSPNATRATVATTLTVVPTPRNVPASRNVLESKNALRVIRRSASTGRAVWASLPGECRREDSASRSAPGERCPAQASVNAYCVPIRHLHAESELLYLEARTPLSRHASRELLDALRVLTFHFDTYRRAARLRSRLAVQIHGARLRRKAQRITVRDEGATEMHLRESLQLARQNVSRAMRLAGIGELAAAIIHETSQSLTAVLTNSHTCLRWLTRPVPEVAQARQAAERAVRDAERATEVIAGLRAIARRSSSARESFDIDQVIREVVNTLHLELKRSAATVVVDLGVLNPVHGDRVQIQQVVTNLLRNACDALLAVDDRPRTVWLTSQDSEGVSATVIVRDNGVGFSPEIAERLGRPLFTTKTNGMGMGLSVSRAIVEAHGGSLTAHSSTGEGTSFRFSIPYNEPASDPEITPRTDEEALDSQQSEG